MTPAGNREETIAWNAVRIAPGDNVAVALRPIEGTARVRSGDAIVEHVLSGHIPLGHKFALADLPAGAEAIKYGEPIGVLTAPVAAGGHVHVHNLASRRAKAATRQFDDAELPVSTV